MTIFAATDGETTPDRVVSVGAELASVYDEKLIVLHVREEFGNKSDLPIEVRSYDVSSEEERRKARQEAKRIADHVVSESVTDPKNVESIGAVGGPTENIVDKAEEYNSRYLVIGGRKRTPVGKAVFGSVTQEVLLDASQPVITVMQD